MKLRVHFLDASQTPVAPSHLVVNSNPTTAFETCLAFRDVVQARRVERVYLRLEEE